MLFAAVVMIVAVFCAMAAMSLLSCGRRRSQHCHDVFRRQKGHRQKQEIFRRPAEVFRQNKRFT
jgi:hypothetical protein